MILRIAVASRRGALFALATLLLAVLALWQGRSAVIFNFTLLRPQVRLPYSEICALVAAALAALVMRPRIWQWERTAGPRAAWVAAGAALVGCLAPVGVVALSFLALPPEYQAAWRLSNALVLASMVFLLSPLLGPALGGALVVLGYFARGIIINIWIDLSFVPVSVFPESSVERSHPHWLWAAFLLVAAVALNARTCGLTSWAQRMFDRDD